MRAEIDWSRLGLSANPFENVLPGQRLEWVDWPPGLAEGLNLLPFAIQLVGQHKGAGKSTLLRACQAELSVRGRTTHFVYVAPGARWREPLPSGTEVLLVDEANRLSRQGWRRVARHRSAGGSILLGTHQPAPLQGLVPFELGRLALRGWIDRRCAAHGWRELPAELAALLPAIERAAQGVNYRIQRILYELLEDRVRGAELDAHALAQALARVPAT